MNDVSRRGPILVVDIGGTKIAAGLATSDRQLDLVQRVPTEAQQGGEALIHRIIDLLKTLAQAARGKNQEPIAIGLGTAGFIDPQTGAVASATANLPGWQGIPLRQRIEQALALPTFVGNDVHVMVLGEAVAGAGQGYRQLIGLTVGTGVGGGVIIDGQLYHGAWGAAGAAGHIIINYRDGRLCSCGRHGCLEAHAAAPAIVADFIDRVGEQILREKLSLEPNKIGVKEIASLAQQEHPEAIAAIQQGASYLGVGIAAILNLFNPELVVVGGGVAQIGELYFDAVQKTIQERVMAYVAKTPIVPAKLGPMANLVGAAHLAWQGLAAGEANKQTPFDIHIIRGDEI